MLSVYIHIPFCSTICSYCDFCKIYYNKEIVDKYLEQLEKEIKSNYKNEEVNTLYIGGGTPTSLNMEQLNKLFNITKLFDFNDNLEFTIECNPENTTNEKLILFKKNNINRLSIGVQTFNKKHLRLLERKHTYKNVNNLIKKAKVLGFLNISIDLIYALPNQTLKESKTDVKKILKYKINHISTYSLSIEKQTKLYIEKNKYIDEKKEYLMYNYICKALSKKGYQHYEISNFAKGGHQSNHNLVYWNNENYYGFGLGAHGYIKGIRYENTKSITKYFEGNYLYKQKKISKREQIENEMMLGLRKIKGINKKHFKNKYNEDIYKMFPIINEKIKNNDLIDDGETIYINQDKLYISNEILIDFIK
jgi:oxygen-independent coproporphyrinogen III oxidase